MLNIVDMTVAISVFEMMDVVIKTVKMVKFTAAETQAKVI